MSLSGISIYATLSLSTIIFRDANEVNTWFEAISVIEHRGSISKSTASRGHYVCDIKKIVLTFGTGPMMIVNH